MYISITPDSVSYNFKDVCKSDETIATNSYKNKQQTASLYKYI